MYGNNKITFSQRLLAQLLESYVYALTEWSRSGGDDRLSAEDARDKDKSVVEEMITIAQQVKVLKWNLMM